MLNNVYKFLSASPAFREAFDAQENGVAALYEMAEGQRPFYAAMLARETGRQVLDYIGKLHEKLGFTVIMITHNQNIAEMAKTVIRMNSGRIAEVYENEQQKTAYEIGW